MPKPLLRRGGRDRRTPEAAAETAALQKTQRRLNVDALIAMGAFSAFGVSAYHVLHGEGPVYFDTAAMLLVLVTVGKLLEASAKSHTSRLVRGLLSLGSRVAHRLTDAGEEDVAPAEIQPGDRVAVRPGEQVPVDGVVRSGSSSVQEATFTGEPQPRPGGPGDRVYGGSVNTDGRLVVEATGVGEDTLLGQMVRLVREAQARRAPVERLADRLAAVFVPLVWVIALGSAGYWTLLRQNWEPAGMAALSVLVVACPCALGLATPLAVSLAIGRAARAGVLVRSGETLERLPRLRRLFADKTGTLTRGTLSLTAIAVLDDPPQPPLRKGGGIPLLASLPQKEDHVLAWTATLESASEHPVAQAIVEAARQRGLALGQVQDFRAIPGHGAEGTVTLGGEQRTLAVGTARFLADRGLAWPEQTPTHPHTPHGEDHSRVFVAWDGRVQARFDLADHARPEAAGVVAELAAQGVQTVLLSGDREEAARRLAQEVGIAEVYAPCNPADKVAVIEAARQSGSLHPLFPLPPPLSPRRLGSYGIAMIGDGLNDAPALAAADVGIALAGGTDLAREAGDVVLLGDELRRLPWLIDLARKSYRIIAQNLFWAFGYNAVALTLAFFGRLHPLLAAVLMLFSSLFVLGNSLRLVRDP